MKSPPRAALVVLGVLWVGWANLSPLWHFGRAGTLADAFFLVAVVGLRAWALLPIAIFWLCLGLYFAFAPHSVASLPVLPLLVPFVVTALVMKCLKPPAAQKRRFLWFRAGRLDSFSRALLVATGLGSTVALLAWAFWTTDLGAGLEMLSGFKQVPFLLSGFGVLVFAFSNAFAEEAAFRGLIQESLHSTAVFGVSAVILFQASAFAALHARAGFPNGLMGYAMVFVYACVLGFLRVRTRGILAPYLAHVISDLTIGCFLLWKVYQP